MLSYLQREEIQTPLTAFLSFSFSARFERHIFESFDWPLVGDCALTRQKMQNNTVPDAMFVSEKPEPTTTIQPTIRPIESPQCPCADPAECCLQVVCSDSLQKEAQEFRTHVECVPQCVHLAIKAAHRYTFYIPLSIWSKRTEYEREQGAPAVEGTCRETR
uniref:Uncharacterized protein n=1 Tax=Ascaris lumbricoides TaxID=6252 RepID=A0A0M3HZ88_ASCLU